MTLQQLIYFRAAAQAGSFNAAARGLHCSQPAVSEQVRRRGHDISYGFEDPTRRQLARRAQEAGVVLEPRLEVEHVETVLQLVSRGLGATMVARAVLNGSVVPDAVTAVGFAEPFYDFFALVTRRGVRLSSPVQEFVELIDDWARGVGARLQRGLSAAATATEP